MRYVLSHTKDNDNDEGLRKKNKIKKNNDMSKRIKPETIIGFIIVSGLIL